MNRYLAFILILLYSLISCATNNSVIEQDGGIVPPSSNGDISIRGSFESKWKRYSQGEQFIGQTDDKYISTIWKDTVWLNDRVHVQLLLWGTEGWSDDLEFELTDLVGENSNIPASNIQLRFPAYVAGDMRALSCEGYPLHDAVYIADALSEKAFTSVSPKEPQKIWLTANIPANVRPGHYLGSIKVKSDGKDMQTFDIDFLVVNHVLPEPSKWKFHLDIWQFPFQLATLCTNEEQKVNLFSEKYFSLIEPFYRLLADAGQKAVSTYIKDGAFGKGQTMVQWKLDKNGNWLFDYTNFDKFVEKMEQWGINKQINCFSLIGWNTSIGYEDADGNNKTMDPAIGSEQYNSIWITFLTSFKNHLLEKGWFDKAVLYMDEIKEKEMISVISLIKEHDPHWKIGLSGSRNSVRIESILYDYSTIFGYERLANTPLSTFYTSCTQEHPNNYVTLENSPAEMTWMPWYVLSKGLDGYLRWAYDYWTQKDPLNVQDGSNTAGDFNMIYRSGNNALNCKPINSIRFELLREGIQDYEKVVILKNNDLNKIISKFKTSTGENAEELVNEAEALLKKISVEN